MISRTDLQWSFTLEFPSPLYQWQLGYNLTNTNFKNVFAQAFSMARTTKHVLCTSAILATEPVKCCHFCAKQERLWWKVEERRKLLCAICATRLTTAGGCYISQKKEKKTPKEYLSRDRKNERGRQEENTKQRCLSGLQVSHFVFEGVKCTYLNFCQSFAVFFFSWKNRKWSQVSRSQLCSWWVPLKRVMHMMVFNCSVVCLHRCGDKMCITAGYLLVSSLAPAFWSIGNAFCYFCAEPNQFFSPATKGNDFAKLQFIRSHAQMGGGLTLFILFYLLFLGGKEAGPPRVPWFRECPSHAREISSQVISRWKQQKKRSSTTRWRTSYFTAFEKGLSSIGAPVVSPANRTFWFSLHPPCWPSTK